MSIRFLRMELYRVLSSKRFPIVVLLMTAVMLGSIYEFIRATLLYGATYESVQEQIMSILVFDRFKALMVLLLSGIVSYSVSDDISEGFLKGILWKVSAEEYTYVKWWANLICILLATVTAFFLFSMIGVLFLGLTFADSSGDYSIFYYYEDIMQRAPVLYIPLSAVLFGMFAVAVTSLGMMVTAVYPGRYLAYAFSFGVYFLTLSLSDFLPFQMMLWYISSGVQVLKTGGFWSNYLYGIGIFTGIALIGLYGFRLVLNRRVEHGNI